MTYEFKLSADTAWCPGCGNPSIRKALKMALEKLNLSQDDVILSAGIGQAGKMPQYIDINSFCGLHGRSLAVGIGMKMANHKMKVIVEGGDGDNYGEGGNHLLHAIRRNIDISHFVHDNQVYGLTKGQASPTTAHGQKTTMQYSGVKSQSVHPLALALTMGAGFVARGFSGDIEGLSDLMVKAINFKGYAIVDILQPCIVWNKVNTFKWYKDHVYKINEDHDKTNFDAAYKLATQWDNGIPLGVLYEVEKQTYTEQFPFLTENCPPLVDAKLDPHRASVLMERLK